MIIGIDFDNTIVAYDTLFHRVAREQNFIPVNLPANKTAVRDHLRATGQENIWTEMQGTVYGARVAEAEIFSGVMEFLQVCRKRGIAVRIISHKTQFPYLGERHDLHAAARAWLHDQGIIDPAFTGISDTDVFFELTKTDKLARIAACGCTHFVDDLPELLGDATFPTNVARFLFDPQHIHSVSPLIQSVESWSSLRAVLFNDTASPSASAEIAGQSVSKFANARLEPLQGGANNRVYRSVLPDGTSALVKKYFQHPGDSRDRFQAEHAFYRYLAACNLKQTPTALNWDITERIGTFSFIEGTRATTVELQHVRSALDFIVDLNARRGSPEALTLPVASEANFSIEAHLASVQRRVDRASVFTPQDSIDEAATAFVARELLPAWNTIRAGVIEHYNQLELSSVLAQDERCISPSDFGFHNSLTGADGKTTFFDFEYAGWDDPAKLVADFFCQPDVPVSLQYFGGFITTVATALKLFEPQIFSARCRALLPVYQVKWACILLNDFSAVSRERRVFSLGAAAAAARRERQLQRARATLGQILQAA